MTERTTADPAPDRTSARVSSQAPAWTPGPRDLANAELLIDGAYAPLRGFLNEADAVSVETYRTLSDGTSWPAPITLTVPDEIAETSGLSELTLQDPEGAPVAILQVSERWWREGCWHLAGPVLRAGTPAYGAFRRLRRHPGEIAAELAGAPTLAVVTDRPLRHPDLAGVRLEAERLGARVLILPLLTAPHPDSLVRAILAAEMPVGSLVVPLPLTRLPGDGERETALHAHVAAAYGATHLLSSAEGSVSRSAADSGGPLPRVLAPAIGFDTRDGAYRPAGEIPDRHLRLPLTDDELGRMLDAGEPLPEREVSPPVAAELRRARPPLTERGLTVFFTGLSGSGKSTIARGLYDALLERGDRTVTLLDGDVVRRMLSAGLTYSRADRDLNIRRIGYVAAEVSRHGGLAICAPIAPYASTRAEVRRMVREAGDFMLVHVATPLEECERRDRKGLYAKARAGVIPEFTGISDPYEEPDDAELVVDTTDISIDDAVRTVVTLLIERGWLR